MKLDLKVGPLSISLGKKPVKKRSWAELHNFFDTTLGYTTDEKATIKSQMAEYRSWIHIATNVIYRRFSEIEYKFFRSDTDEEIKKRNPSYKAINQIFKDPNPWMEFRFLKQWVQLQLDLTGHAFILREDDVFGRPYRLYPLNVANFDKVVKGNTYADYIKGFRFRGTGGDYITYSPDSILYLHYPNPTDPRDGASPIQQQAYAIDVDHYIEVYERMFFKNSARPDFAIKYPENVQIEEEDAKRIIGDWKKKFKGEEAYHEVALLDQGADITELTAKNEDLALAWLAGWSQDKILSAYTVPKGKVGIMVDINKSSSQSIEETFNRECILPRLRLFDEVVTRGVMQRFDERLEMRHNNPVPKDQELLLKEHDEKTGVPTRTVNEQRELDGQKSYEGGDVILVPLNYIPLGTPRQSPAPPPPPPGKEGEEEEEEETEPEKIFECKEFYSEEWLDKRWYVFKAYTEGWESVWMSQLAYRFGEQQEEVIRNLESYWDTAKEIFNKYERIKESLKTKLPEFMERHWAKTTEDIVRYFEQNQEVVEKIVEGESGIAKIIMEALIKEDADILLQFTDYIKVKQSEAIDHILFDWDDNIQAFDRTGTQLTGAIIQETANEELTSLGLQASFSLQNPMAKEYLGSKVREFSTSVLSTKYNQLRVELGEGFAAGEGIRKMTQRVQDVYGQVLNSQYEALRIARTETVAASNAGAMMGYEASGVVKEKEWLATRDMRTRGAHPKDPADHWYMDGQRVKLNEYFVDHKTQGAMMHPGDTSQGAPSIDIIMCRCTMVPYTEATQDLKSTTVDDYLSERDLSAVSRSRGRRSINSCYATPIPAPKRKKPTPRRGAEPGVTNATTTSLSEGTVTNIEPMDGGINASDLVSMTYRGKPVKGVYKPVHGEKWGDIRREYKTIVNEQCTLADREVLAYELDQTVGWNRVPATSIKYIDGQKGSIQLFVDDAIEESKWAGRSLTGAEQYRIGTFDYLIGNTDRHTGNWMRLQKEGATLGNPVMIDHGYSFPKATQYDHFGLEEFRCHAIRYKERPLDAYIEAAEKEKLVTGLSKIDLKKIQAQYHLSDSEIASLESRIRELSLAIDNDGVEHLLREHLPDYR